MYYASKVLENIEDKEPDLEDILDVTANPEIVELLNDKSVFETLSQFLPESQAKTDDIIEQLQSKQFKKCLRNLGHTLNSAELISYISTTYKPG